MIQYIADWAWGFGQGGARDFVDELEGRDCTVHEYDANRSGSKVRNRPKRRRKYRRNSKGHRITHTGRWVDPTPQQIRDWQNDMAAELRMRDQAIQDHVDALRGGVELGFFHIYAHGSACPSSDCGYWATGLRTAPMWLSRTSHNQSLYGAAKAGDICEHVLLDSSCYSGCTPKGGERANKMGAVDCRPPTADQCPNRAAHDADVWLGSADDTSLTWDIPVAFDQAQLEDAFEEADDTPNKHEIAEHIDTDVFNSSYSDSGTPVV